MVLNRDNSEKTLSKNDTICLIKQLDNIISMSLKISNLLNRVKSLKNTK